MPYKRRIRWLYLLFIFIIGLVLCSIIKYSKSLTYTPISWKTSHYTGKLYFIDKDRFGQFTTPYEPILFDFERKFGPNYLVILVPKINNLMKIIRGNANISRPSSSPLIMNMTIWYIFLRKIICRLIIWSRPAKQNLGHLEIQGFKKSTPFSELKW